jgi:hypothetical protein
MLLVLAVVVLSVLYATIRTIRSDGHGQAPEEPSHHSWTAEGRPSAPYSSGRV